VLAVRGVILTGAGATRRATVPASAPYAGGDSHSEIGEALLPATVVGSVADEYGERVTVSGHYERRRRRVHAGEQAAEPDGRDPKPQRQYSPWHARLAWNVLLALKRDTRWPKRREGARREPGSFMESR